MDLLLNGLLCAENLTDTLKRQLVRVTILPQASLPIDADTCSRLLEMAWTLAVSSDKLLDKEVGIKVFQAWVPHHKTTVAEWASPQRIESLLCKVDSGTDRTTLFQLLMFLLDNMESRSGTYASSLLAVCQHAPRALQGSQGLEPLLVFAQLLRRFPQPHARQHSLDLLRAMALLHVQLPVQDVIRQKVDMICLALKGILTEDKSFSLVVIDLLQELLTTRDIPCSLVLATILEILELSDKEIESHCLRAVSMTVDDGLLHLVLHRLLTWLNWPRVKNYRNWILCFLMTCNKRNRRRVVESTLTSSLREVLHALVYPDTKDAAYMVFQYIVLVYPQCPEVMRKVLELTPRVIEEIQQQPEPDPAFVSNLQKQLEKAKAQLDFRLGWNVCRPDGSEAPGALQYRTTVGAQSSTASPTEEPSADKMYTTAGLENLGNTCYINSVVQALNMTYRFRHLVLQWSQEAQQGVLLQLQEVLAFLLLTKRPVYCPRKFLEVARPGWFVPGEQQDCQEFLSHLFDLLEEEQKACGSSPFVRDVFGGTTETCITCSLCEKTSVTTDLFYSLLLPLSGMEGLTNAAITLEDVLSSYLKPELLEGRNKYKCDNCDKLEEARRRIRITNAPRHLILTLLRFEYESNHRRKISVPVCLPGTLELPTETVDGGHSAVTYSLYAAIVHSGSSAEKGHYFTYARCSASGHTSAEAEGGWYLFNDESVSGASFQTLHNVSLSSCRDTVYMLFYSRSGEESFPADPLSLISHKLRDQVLIDNFKYIKEEQQKAISRRQPAKFPEVRRRRDSDEDQPPPPPPSGSGGCGLGGGFGSLDSPSRIVF